jgi:hypothetical protein
MSDFNLSPLDKLIKIEEQVGRETELLFGPCKRSNAENCQCTACTPPNAELEITFDSRLALFDKMARLQVLRGGKQIKPKSFHSRVKEADRLRARALSIRL